MSNKKYVILCGILFVLISNCYAVPNMGTRKIVQDSYTEKKIDINSNVITVTMESPNESSESVEKVEEKSSFYQKFLGLLKWVLFLIIAPFAVISKLKEFFEERFPSLRKKYICKYCGYKANSKADLMSRPCLKNSNGKFHSPLE